MSHLMDAIQADALGDFHTNTRLHLSRDIDALTDEHGIPGAFTNALPHRHATAQHNCFRGSHGSAAPVRGADAAARRR